MTLHLYCTYETPLLLDDSEEGYFELRALFFLFLAYSGVVYAAGSKEKAKKHTEHERVQFWGTTEHEGALRARHTAKTH